MSDNEVRKVVATYATPVQQQVALDLAADLLDARAEVARERALRIADGDQLHGRVARLQFIADAATMMVAQLDEPRRPGSWNSWLDKSGNLALMEATEALRAALDAPVPAAVAHDGECHPVVRCNCCGVMLDGEAAIRAHQSATCNPRVPDGSAR